MVSISRQAYPASSDADAGRPPNTLIATDSPPPGAFEAIRAALDASSQPVIGPATMRLLVIPIRTDNGAVAGGLWGYTLFRWLHIQMLFVPEVIRGCRVGTTLVAAAEAAATARGCGGSHVDAFNFQAAEFYRRLGYTQFGALAGYPPGYERLYFQKRFAAASVPQGAG